MVKATGLRTFVTMKNTIDSIEPIPRRKGVYKVTLDDESFCLVHAEIIARHNLKAGLVVDVDELHQYVFESNIKLAYNMAIKNLGYRQKSRKDLSDYLERKGFEEKVILIVLEKLESYNFVNDEVFAKHWVENKRLGKPAGRRLIAQELKKKGISDSIAEKVLDTISPEEEYQAAQKLAGRYVKKYQGLSEEEIMNKAGRALMRRGFDWETTKKAVQSYIEDPLL